MPEVSANPFPGLRPYQDYEASLFFGRKDPAADIIERLGRTRFIAVVGTSGSGKSSIVNCGVLPTLYAGFYLPRGSRWRVVRTEPGGEPIRRLAQQVTSALSDRLGTESGNGHGPADQSVGHIDALSEAILRYAEDGLVNLVRQARLPRSDNVLIVVDQFEELFRYKDQHTSPDEAVDFVKLLLRAAEDETEHIYVMLTMRSDFLGDCMVIPGLPEAINDGLFLVPAMGRDEREQAVRGPVKVSGAEIEPPLVNRILEDIGDELDQLPLLQHALMRTWQQWQQDAREAKGITLRHYLATVHNGTTTEAAAGTEHDAPAEPEKTVIERSLDDHAQAVWESLTERQQEVARKIFQAITEVDDQGRRGRRPRRLGPAPGEKQEDRKDLSYVTSLPIEELIPVIEVFRATDRSFLKPEPRQELESGTVIGEDLHAGSVIDVWHESLIRNWSKLHDEWMVEEARDRDIYTDLARETAGENPSLTPAKLQTSLEWTDRLLADVGTERVPERPTWVRRVRGLNPNETVSLQPWASKYAESASRQAEVDNPLDAFSNALGLLNRSRAAWIRRWRRRAYVAALVVGTLVVALVRQSAHTAAAVRSSRVQVAGALADPLVQALVLTGVSDQTPDNWLAAWFAGPFLRFGTDRTPLMPAGMDSLAAASLVGGFPSAALTDPDLFDLDEVLALDIALGDSLIVFAGVKSTEEGPHGLLVRWTPISPGSAEVLWKSQSVHPSDVRVRADGAVVALMNDGSVARWAAGGADTEVLELSDGGDEMVRRWLADDPAGDAASLDGVGSSLAVVYDTEAVVVWRLAGPGTADSAGPDPVVYEHLDAMDVRLSPDGSLVASADSYGGIRLFDVDANSVVWEVEPGTDDEYVPSVRFSDDGQWLAWAAPGGAANVLDVSIARNSTAEPTALSGHAGQVTNVRFGLSAAQLVTVSADSTAIIWDVGSGEAVHTLRGHTGRLNDGRFSSEGSLVLTTAADGTARVWDAGTGAELRTLIGGGGHVLAKFGYRSPVVATVAARGGPRIWPLDGWPDLVIQEEATPSPLSEPAGDPTDTLTIPDVIPENDRVASSFDLSPDGRTALVSFTKAAVLFVRGEAEPFTTPAHDVEINAVALAPDGRRFAVALGKDEDSQASTIALWVAGAERASELTANGSIKALAFSPDGDRLAAAGETVQLWNPHTRSLLEVFGQQTEGGGLYEAVEFSADGRYLSAKEEGGAVRTWRVDVRSLAVSEPAGDERSWPSSDWTTTTGEIGARTTACLTEAQRVEYLGESEGDAAAAATRCREAGADGGSHE